MTRDDIVLQLRQLSTRMINLGTAMDYYGGRTGEISAHGREMIRAAIIAEEWADGIEEEANESQPGE